MVSNLLFYIISNLNPHCSDANLQESRQLRKLVKIAWAFTPGGCTDVDAGPDNNMVNLEKTWVCRYYRAARWDKENGPRWCKSPKDGGVKSYERRAYYMSWVSRARKEFLENVQGEIWKRRQECGFVLAIDGSENHKLHFRDGKYDYGYRYWDFLYLCEAKTILSCQRFCLWLGGKIKVVEREEFSDEEDCEDKESDVEDITIPVKSRKRKITSSGKKAKKPRLQIPKKSARQRRAQEPPGPPPCPPPKWPRHKPKASQIASKN